MMTTATRNEHYTAKEPVLFLAFELSEKSWKLGFPLGHGQKPRERTIAARDPKRLLEEVGHAKARFGLPETTPVVVAMKRAAKASGSIAFCRRRGSPTMWWIPPRLKSIVTSIGPRLMRLTCEIVDHADAL